MSWLELSAAQLAANVERIRELAGQREVCLVVKANAYGHGIAQVVPKLMEHGVSWLAVQTLEEVELVRRAGYVGRLILLGPFNSKDLPALAREQVRVSLRSTQQTRALVAWCKAERQALPIHLEVDLGMHRYGLSLEELAQCAQELASAGMHAEGLFGHYPAVDESSSTRAAELWGAAIAVLPACEVYHLSKTEVLHMPALPREAMVRVGLGLYGDPGLGTLPFATWKAALQQVHEVTPGELIGYDRRYMAKQRMRIGVVPVGYAEGIPFSFTNCGRIRHADGSLLPIRGSVCMNACMVELQPHHDVGDVVQLAPVVENQGLPGVSRYELLTRMHPDLPRYFC